MTNGMGRTLPAFGQEAPAFTPGESSLLRNASSAGQWVLNDLIISRLEASCLSRRLLAASADQFLLVLWLSGFLRRVGGQAQEGIAHGGGDGGAERAEEEGGVESAIERGDLARGSGEQTGGAHIVVSGQRLAVPQERPSIVFSSPSVLLR